MTLVQAQMEANGVAQTGQSFQRTAGEEEEQGEARGIALRMYREGGHQLGIALQKIGGIADGAPHRKDPAGTR